MKHLLKNKDIEDADFGRVLLKEDGSVVMKGFDFNFPSTYGFVDLGLPSGRLWCDRNVGASSPEDNGLYFAWGETEGYTKEQVEAGEKKFSWEDYKYGNAYNKLEKYCNKSSYGKDGFTDNLITLEAEDDAATANMGSSWRMPTHEEQIELFQNTDKELLLSDGTSVKVEGNNNSAFNWPTNNYNGTNVKVLGMKFINRKDSSKFIFIPAAGYAGDGSVVYVGVRGICWSASVNESHCSDGWDFYFLAGVAGAENINYRGYGLSVRAVRCFAAPQG